MSIAIHGTNGVTYNDGTQQSSAPVGKNLIINGDMRIAQRGTSSTSLGYYTVDRYYNNAVSTDQLAITQSQSTDTPSTEGFSNSFKNEATTAESAIDADDLFNFANYTIEAQDCQHLKYGTANAVTTTLSFWVKSSVTGTYVVGLYIQDSSRLRTFTYTISSANTWEKKTITITGDTVGSINNDNGAGIRLIWVGFAGSNWNSTDSSNWINYASTGWAYGHTATWGASTSDTFYLTGIQLEVGEGASDFEFLPYDVQLARCQRYFLKTNQSNSNFPSFLSGTCFTSSAAALFCSFPVTMRAAPTYTSGGTYNTWWISGITGGATGSFNNTYTNLNIEGAMFETQSMNAGAVGYPIGYNGQLSFNAEL